jgi:hypothetical protein
LGRWLSKDALWEIASLNLYEFIDNESVNGWDFLGKWKKGGHKSLTKASWNKAIKELPKCVTQNPSINKKILEANLDVDKGNSFDDLKQHYNRGLKDDIDKAKKDYAKYLKDKRKALDDDLDGSPTKEECENALEKLGQLSHSWQDYYAHAVDKTSPYQGDPGKITGSPDTQGENMKPSSWGSIFFNWGEHGRNEPAARRSDDGKERKKQATDFVAKKYEEIMADWAKKCCKYYEK